MEPDGRRARWMMGRGKPVWKLDAAVHGHLVELGARVFDSAGLPEFFG